MPKARLLCLALLLCLCGGSAFADFAASTSGQFYVGSTSLGTSTWGLSFQGTPSFSVSPTTTQVSLGSFNLSTALSYFDPFDFALSVNFVGGSGATFKADLSGLVTFLGGSATVNFDNTPHQFTFGADSFSLSITDVKVKNKIGRAHV